MALTFVFFFFHPDLSLYYKQGHKINTHWIVYYYHLFITYKTMNRFISGVNCWGVKLQGGIWHSYVRCFHSPFNSHEVNGHIFHSVRLFSVKHWQTNMHLHLPLKSRSEFQWLNNLGALGWWRGVILQDLVPQLSEWRAGFMTQQKSPLHAWNSFPAGFRSCKHICTRRVVH